MRRSNQWPGYHPYKINGKPRTETSLGRLSDEEYAAMASSNRSKKVTTDGHNYRIRRERYVREERERCAVDVRRDD